MNSRHQPPRTKRVFIADGSQLGVSRVINLLAFSDNTEVVGFAQDSATTLASTTALHPDVVILDIEMPDMSGIQLLRQLKSINPDLTVIVFTNASDDQYRKRCLEAGASYFLDKSREFWKINEVLSPLPSNPYQV